MKAALLPDRGVIRIEGGETARHLLNGLITTDVDKVAPGAARFGALLTPQGKIISDFLITQTGDAATGDFLLDCPRDLAAPLAGRLNMYKLRARVTIADVSETRAVIAVWDGTPPAQGSVAFADPRGPEIGWRVIVPAGDVAATLQSLGGEVGVEAYEAHRIASGVPRGGADFAYSDAFPHEANMDKLAGVDFGKGCYVGQEVVSRMQHRGTARTRIVRVTYDGAPPAPGAEVTAAGKAVGRFGTASQGRGLALLRIDRVGEALEAGAELEAAGVALRIEHQDDIKQLPKAIKI